MKSPEQFYKVGYSSFTNLPHAAYWIGECLTEETATTLTKEVVMINGWTDGVIYLNLVERGTNHLIELTEIEVKDLMGE